MKQSFDSYGLYRPSVLSNYIIRTRVDMTEPVDPDVLCHAINVASRRYPYFLVKAALAEDGSYCLLPNEADVVVLPTSCNLPDICTKEVNEHLLYADYEGNTIYFNFSHALAGGRGVLPWIQTCVYQYVTEKYGVTLDAPAIRKPGSDLLPGETAEPTPEMVKDAVHLPKRGLDNAYSFIKDYINGIFNPFTRSKHYYAFSFRTSDILQLSKANDHSVNSFFVAVMLKALDRILPEKAGTIAAEIEHNTAADLGIPNTHCNVLSHIVVSFTRKQIQSDMEKLGTIIRGATILQSDPQYSLYEQKEMLKLLEKLDNVTGHKEKLKFAKKNHIGTGGGIKHGTFIVSYTGNTDWGDVRKYIKSFYFIAGAHQLLEISSLGDELFCAYHEVLKTKKYINAFKSVLDDLNIPYKIEGPFDTNLVHHKLP